MHHLPMVSTHNRLSKWSSINESLNSSTSNNTKYALDNYNLIDKKYLKQSLLDSSLLFNQSTREGIKIKNC